MIQSWKSQIIKKLNLKIRSKNSKITFVFWSYAHIELWVKLIKNIRSKTKAMIFCLFVFSWGLQWFCLRKIRMKKLWAVYESQDSQCSPNLAWFALLLITEISKPFPKDFFPNFPIGVWRILIRKGSWVSTWQFVLV